MARQVRESEEGIHKKELIATARTSIAWAKELVVYLPFVFKDIIYDKKKQIYKSIPIDTDISDKEKE